MPDEAPPAAASQRNRPGGAAAPADNCENVGYQDVKKNRPARKETGAGRQREC